VFVTFPKALVLLACRAVGVLNLESVHAQLCNSLWRTFEEGKSNSQVRRAVLVLAENPSQKALFSSRISQNSPLKVYIECRYPQSHQLIVRPELLMALLQVTKNRIGWIPNLITGNHQE